VGWINGNYFRKIAYTTMNVGNIKSSFWN